MRTLIVLALFLVSCSASVVQKNSNLVVTQNRDESDSNQKKNASIPETWEIRINDSNLRTAVVMVTGKTPNGEAHTILRLQCPANPKYVISVQYIVRETNKITGFNFDDFEGPDAPAQNKKLVKFHATSPSGNLSFKASGAGGYGGAGEPDAFFFTTGNTKQDKITQLAQMIARGSTELTVVVHDYRDNRKTIESTFPGIDASGDVAKILDGCRK